MPAGPTVRRITRAGALAAIVAGLGSASYQRYATARDRRRHPPPGTLIDIGGRRLHLRQIGTGSPTIVIEPSLGGSSLEWAHIQQTLADVTTVVTYDRAGLGWSDPDLPLWPRTASRMADDLHQLLTAAAVPPPYILVGHSIGGYVVRLYAARHPTNCSAIVLAESSHPDQWQRLGQHDRWRYSRTRMLLQAARSLLRPSGLYRLASDLGLRPEHRQQQQRQAERAYPPDLRQAAVAVNRRWRHAGRNELLWIRRSCAQVRAEATTLGDIPLLVITAADSGASLGDTNTRDAQEQAWTTMQAELAALSTRSRHLTIPNASHHLHHDAPDPITGAIRELIENVRAAPDTTPTPKATENDPETSNGS